MPAESRAGRQRPAKAAERLGRLLAIVPWFVEHPGGEVAEAARLFDLDEVSLVDDLKILFMSGLPPYSPGDLIDVDIQDGRAWITMADHFGRPLRLTRNEALSLYLRGTTLAGLPGLPEAGALASALTKLRDHLGPDTLGSAERVEAADVGRVVELLDAVRNAAGSHEQIEVDYLAATGQTSVRRIDPEEVFSELGNWYVAAWDHLSGEERLFRADRIREVRTTGERFEPRGLRGAGRALYSPTERDLTVRLRLAPEARWVAEYHPVESKEELESGGLEVSMRVRDLTWAARLVLRVAPGAEVIEPEALRERVRELAGATRDQYFRGSPAHAGRP